MEQVHRSITVKRKSITVISKQGYKKVGGYFIFNRPKGDPPRWKVKPSQRILWCPYCAQWAIFVSRIGESDVWFCPIDGWAHTREFHVSRTNSLMWEGMSVAKVKEFSKFAVPRG